MAYARLPDTFPFAMETMSAGNAATGALCRYLAWSAGNRTDGFVPDGIAEIIGNKKERDALATLGLLEPVVVGEVRIATGRISKKADVRVVMPADGYWMPKYHVYNISALEDHAAIEKARKGGLQSGRVRSPEREDRQPSEPRVEPGVEPEAEEQVEPTVEPTGQDKTGQEIARAAVKETKKEPDPEQDDSEEEDHTAPSEDDAVPVQDDAREGVVGVPSLDDALMDPALYAQFVAPFAQLANEDGVPEEIDGIVGEAM